MSSVVKCRNRFPPVSYQKFLKVMIFVIKIKNTYRQNDDFNESQGIVTMLTFL